MKPFLPPLFRLVHPRCYVTLSMKLIRVIYISVKIEFSQYFSIFYVPFFTFKGYDEKGLNLFPHFLTMNLVKSISIRRFLDKSYEQHNLNRQLGTMVDFRFIQVLVEINRLQPLQGRL